MVNERVTMVKEARRQAFADVVQFQMGKLASDRSDEYVRSLAEFVTRFLDEIRVEIGHRERRFHELTETMPEPETTVWACKACGRCSGGGDQCARCGGTMAQLAESDAIRRYFTTQEPDTGWYDDETMRRDWAAGR